MTWPRLLRLVAGGALATSLTAAAPLDHPPLRPAEPVTRELTAGESHVWEAELTAGRPWRIAVEQRGIDVTLEIRAPDGQRLLVDSPVDRDGTESLLWRPAADGLYRIEVRSREPGAPSGRYEIRIEEVDTARAEAEEAVTRAGSLYAEGSTDSRRKAIAEQRRALDLWRALGDPREEARAVYALAVLSRLVDDTRAALAFAREALPLWQALGDRVREASTWNETGLDLWLLGETGEARAAFERALGVEREAGDRYGEAASLGNLCLMDLQRGDLRAGLACYERALPLLAEVRAPALEGAALTNVGRAWDVLGEPERALDAYGRALERLRSTGNREGEARALNNLALLHQEMGEVQEALALYGEALEIFRALDDRRWQARVLNNIGLVYHALGEPGRALSQYEQALKLWRAVDDRAGEANTLSNLGAAHGRLGQPAEALAFHRQALDLRRAAGDRRGEGIALARLASTRLDQGDLAAALADYGGAAERLRAAGDLANEADAELGRGRVQMRMAEPAKALASFTRALEIARGVKHPAVEAQALGEMARAERLLGHAAEARDRAAESLEVVEALRTRIGSPDLRAAFSATQQRTWDLRLELLMEAHRAGPAAGHDRAAFEAAERARARTLIELLGEAGVDLREGVDPELLRRRTSLQRRLSAKAERALREKSQSGFETEREEILRELDLVEAEIRRRHPGFAALTRPRPLSAAEIQALLGPDTLLLSFALGEERSWLWAVTATSLDAFELPRRAEIETAARALHEALSTFDVADRPAQSRAAAELSRILLGPLAERLNTQRLAIVADGALGYLPFGVLPRPGSDEPLLARHEMVHLPSASALAVQREILTRRAPAARQVAVVADPVFDPADGFAPLPASRQEAAAIAALAAPGQALAALGADAGRELALGGGLSGYRTVHFATHGVIDAEHPALSGLALATLDERGRPREGFLHLRDIYNLRLGADLVVLSGCRTALGREVRGEGLVGLTRGFLYAGAPRVVASLWRVEDRATAELMARFYRALWVDGLPPAAALRAAQLSIREERRWRDPWFWAGWVIQGVWP